MKNRPYRWGEKQEEAFHKLKECLCTAELLAYPVAGEKFVLDTDASAKGTCGVLSQVNKGQERDIGYYSRIQSKPQRSYCVTRRGFLAVVECVKHYHKYLYGQQFQLRTDHSALRWLLKFKNPEGQLSYDFSIEYRKCGKHGNADTLSRRPCKQHYSKAEVKKNIIDVHLLRLESNEDWATTQ